MVSAEEADKAMALVRQAATLLRGTPGRRGNVIHLDGAEELAVVGDLHGNTANLREALRRAALADYPRRHLVLQEFVHGRGRYPDGSDTSHRMLEVVAALKVQYPDRVHLIPGNHELAELTGRQVAKDNVPLNHLFSAGVAHRYGDAAPLVFEAYMEMLRAMPLAVRTPNRILATHTIPPPKIAARFDFNVFERPGLRLDDSDRGSSLYGLLWGRDLSAEAADIWAAKADADWLVTGHVAQPGTGFSFPNPRQLVVCCVGSPAAMALLPAERPLDADGFRAGVVVW